VACQHQANEATAALHRVLSPTDWVGNSEAAAKQQEINHGRGWDWFLSVCVGAGPIYRAPRGGPVLHLLRRVAALPVVVDYPRLRAKGVLGLKLLAFVQKRQSARRYARHADWQTAMHCHADCGRLIAWQSANLRGRTLLQLLLSLLLLKPAHLVHGPRNLGGLLRPR
jgi:hypothetical protein